MESRNLNIENAHLLFRNFSGKGDKFNREGNRNFCVRIDDPEFAIALINDGWNVKQLRPRDGEDEGAFYIQVQVSYRNYPPKVYMFAGKSRVQLDEESISTLDFAEITHADLIISPYNWEVNGKTGIKAYLKTAYITIEQDAFAAKYAEEESPSEGVPF